MDPLTMKEAAKSLKSQLSCSNICAKMCVGLTEIMSGLLNFGDTGARA